MPQGFSIQSDSDTGPGSATQVTIEERVGESTSFQVRYPVEAVDGDLPVLSAPGLEGGKNLQVICESDGGLISLVKGPIKGQHVHLQHGPVHGYVEVYGADGTSRMDREVQQERFEATESSVMTTILNRYFDVVTDSDLAPSGGKPPVLIQSETDLRFVRKLARRNGRWLHATSTPEGIETAALKEMSLSKDPVAELVINHQGANLDALDLYWDIERPTRVVARQLGLEDKKVSRFGHHPGAPLPTGQQLADVAGSRSVSLVTPVAQSAQLQGRTKALLDEARWFIRARCSTTVHRLGKVLQTHDVVGLKGMGSRHDGLYYVTEVHHVIDAMEHRMELELSRDRWSGGLL